MSGGQTFEKGEIVEIKNHPKAKYNGMKGKVLEKTKKFKAMVEVEIDGVKTKLRLTEDNLEKTDDSNFVSEPVRTKELDEELESVAKRR